VAHELIRGPGKARRIIVFPTREETLRFMSGQFQILSRRAISEKGMFAAALSGGTTPTGFYEDLRLNGGSLDWTAIHIFLVDERFVPPTDRQSNYRMIKESLLDGVPVPAANVHLIPTGDGDPSTCASEYEETVVRFFRSGGETRPVFDFIVLGLGEDGHTASLFPGSEAALEEKHLVRAVAAAKERLARISFTLPLINEGRHLFVLATGKAKATVMKRVAEDGDRTLPAALVWPRQGELTFVCDSEAASLLNLKDRNESSKV
jgi:6-phosphogluconolactonase